MGFSTPENIEQNKVQCESTLKWGEVPMKVIYCIETAEQITTRLGRVTMVVSLVDEDGMNLKAFATRERSERLQFG